MVFAYDTEQALLSASALVNTSAAAVDALTSVADLDVFVREQQFSGSRTGTLSELRSVRQLRTQLRPVWTDSEEDAVRRINILLRNAHALPQLVRHDQWNWHVHATTPEAPLALRMGTEAAMALIDVVRVGELERLRICAAEGCQAVLVDLTKNRSKRFCDTGNCANRTHVAAYRRRRSSRTDGTPTVGG
ncbi:MAG: RNA-binding protein [Micrococcaceae bacterium]|nr:RNA-binding protein [Micrococcaceae bacterium]